MARTNVLIVGDRGYIGSNLKEKITADGLDIGLDFIQCYPTLPKYNTIIFLAANLEFTREAYAYNEQLYEALDGYMKRYPKTHIIFTSSSFVIPEKTNIYGHSKRLGETYVGRYKRHTILRLGNVYGKGGHSAIDKFMAGGNVIHGNGQQRRDFVHINVVTEAIKRATERKIYGTYDIGSGYSLSIAEVYQLFGSVVPKFALSTPYGLQEVYLDISSARKAGLL